MKNNIERIVFDVKQVAATKHILKENLTLLGTAITKANRICELQLETKTLAISLFVTQETFKRIKSHKQIAVEFKKNLFWNTLTDKGVTVKDLEGNIIKPVKTY